MGGDQGQVGWGAQPPPEPPYGQPQYSQPQYGQPQYGQPQYGQPQYGQLPGWQAPPVLRPGIIPLRPIGLGELYDGAFQAIRHNPRVMFGATAVVLVITTVLTTLAQGVGFAALFDVGTSADSDPAADAAALVGVYGGTLLTLAVQSLAVLVLTGLLIVSVARSVLGQRLTLGELWTQTRPRVLPLIGVTLLLGLGAVLAVVVAVLVVVAVFAATDNGAATFAAGALVALVVLLGVLYLATRWSLATPALVLERVGVFRSLRRSWALVGGVSVGRFWRVFGILWLTQLIVGFAAQAVAVPFAIAGFAVLGASGLDEAGAPGVVGFLVYLLLTQIGTLIGLLLTIPFLSAVTALLYVDLRMRQEGLDVDLARAAGDGARVGPRVAPA